MASNIVDFKDYMIKTNEKYKGSDDFLGLDCLTLPNKANSSRLIMFNTHISQHTTLDEPEFPMVFTGYETPLGQISNYFIKYDEEKTVQKVIRKNDYNYSVILKNKNNEYDIVTREECSHLTEKFCVPMRNKYIDGLKEGDVVPVNKAIIKSKSFDESDNYCYGVNAKVVFICDYRTTEDALVISESFAKKLKSYSMYEVEVMINKNDILLNTYGKNITDFKPFPDIGEKIKDGILLSRRRISNSDMLFSLTDLALQTPNMTDQKFYVNGKITDISIFNNREDIDILKDVPYFKQIWKYWKEEIEYKKLLKAEIDSILATGGILSDELRYQSNRINEELDINKKYTLDKQEYEGTLIKFKVLKEKNIEVGDKLTGRFGNKATLAVIVPDSEMPIDEDGTVADMIQNAYSMPNRLNPAQNFEVELSYCASEISKRIRNMTNEQEKLDLYIEFIYDTSRQYYENLIKQIDDTNVSELINSIERAIYIHQSPFWENVNILELEHIYDKYDIKSKTFYLNGQPMQNKMIMGDMYIMKLKHEAYGKYSVRSTSHLNMKNTPSKSIKYKEFKSLYSNTPIRIGEMETTGLLLHNDPQLVRYIIDSYSSSDKSRNKLIETKLYGKKQDIQEKNTNVNKENLKMVFRGMGFKLI